jgi:hypothetical protein
VGTTGVSGSTVGIGHATVLDGGDARRGLREGRCGEREDSESGVE